MSDGLEIQRGCVGFVRGSMGCPALNFLDLFDGRPLPFFLGQCQKEHRIKSSF